MYSSLNLESSTPSPNDFMILFHTPREAKQLLVLLVGPSLWIKHKIKYLPLSLPCRAKVILVCNCLIAAEIWTSSTGSALQGPVHSQWQHGLQLFLLIQTARENNLSTKISRLWESARQWWIFPKHVKFNRRVNCEYQHIVGILWSVAKYLKIVGSWRERTGKDANEARRSNWLRSDPRCIQVGDRSLEKQCNVVESKFITLANNCNAAPVMAQSLARIMHLTHSWWISSWGERSCPSVRVEWSRNGLFRILAQFQLQAILGKIL